MFGLKNDEILTCLLLIIVGYTIAKMFSKRCEGFSVDATKCSDQISIFNSTPTQIKNCTKNPNCKFKYNVFPYPNQCNPKECNTGDLSTWLLSSEMEACYNTTKKCAFNYNDFKNTCDETTTCIDNNLPNCESLKTCADLGGNISKQPGAWDALILEDNDNAKNLCVNNGPYTTGAQKCKYIPTTYRSENCDKTTNDCVNNYGYCEADTCKSGFKLINDTSDDINYCIPDVN